MASPSLRSGDFPGLIQICQIMKTAIHLNDVPLLFSKVEIQVLQYPP